MSVLDKYSEISGTELVNKLRKYVEMVGIDFSIVKEYLPLYPDRVYRNIYEGGLMGELYGIPYYSFVRLDEFIETFREDIF